MIGSNTSTFRASVRLTGLPVQCPRSSATVKSRRSTDLSLLTVRADTLRSHRRPHCDGAGSIDGWGSPHNSRAVLRTRARVATVLNNYLSPGLRGNPIFDSYMGVGNAMNQAQLGLSAFHLGFTSLDAAVSKTALGVEQLAAGRVGAAAKSFAQVPTAPITNYLQGSKVLSEYLRPGSVDGEMADIVDGLVAGGGRVRQDDFYKTNAISKFTDALAARRLDKAAFHPLPAALEMASKPILEHIVPRQKLGVFADLARFELEKLGPNASKEEARGNGKSLELCRQPNGPARL
jgi:hypothetical protein